MRDDHLHAYLPHPAFVVVFDLEQDAADLRKLPISELQVRQSPPVEGGTIDAQRVIALCDLHALADHVDILRRVQMAPSVHRVICLITGRPASHGPSGPQVVLPPEFDALHCAAIWVGDPRGVVWAIGGSRARRLTVFESDPRGDGAMDALHEVLRIPEVFDAVYEAVPSGVVSPALRILVPGLSDESLLRRAEVAAIDELTDVAETAVNAHTFADELHVPSDVAGAGALPADFFTPDGAIGERSAKVVATWSLAVEHLRTLRSRPTIRGRQAATDAVQRVGYSLGELKHELRELVVNVEPSNGIDESELRLIDAAGVHRQVLGRFRAHQEAGDTQEEAIRTYVLAEVLHTPSVPSLAAELAGLAARAQPRTGEESVKALDRACPDDIIVRLATAPKLELHPTPASSLALVLFAAGTVWLPGLLRIVPVLLLLAAVVGLACVGWNGPWPGWRGIVASLRQAPSSGAFALRTFAVFCGAVIGLVFVLVVGESTPLTIAGAVLVVGSLLVYCLSTWRAGVSDWISSWGVLDIVARPGIAGNTVPEPPIRVHDESVLGRIQGRARDIIASDWLSANARLEFARCLSRVSAALDGVQELLLEEGRQRRADGGGDAEPPRAPCNPAVRADLTSEGLAQLHRRADVIEEIVLSDYRDAIGRSIDDAWPLLMAKAADAPADQVGRHFAPWLERYGRSLREFGLFGHGVKFEQSVRRLLSAPGLERRDQLLDELWRNLDLESMLREDDLIQYCRAEDLVLLDQVEEHSLIRFAPDSTAPTRHPFVRTRSTLMAGIIRLVPIRQSAAPFGDADGARSSTIALRV